MNGPGSEFTRVEIQACQCLMCLRSYYCGGFYCDRSDVDTCDLPTLLCLCVCLPVPVPLEIAIQLQGFGPGEKFPGPPDAVKCPSLSIN